MIDTTTAPYQSTAPARRDGFGNLLRAEWTKFRTVRGWLIGTVLAVLIMVALGVLTGVNSHSSYSNGPGQPDTVGHPYVPLGPGGEAVTDEFYFVHQALDGDGSITARITSLTGGAVSQPNGPSGDDVLQPWAKAGLIMKDGTKQGSAYAAIMLTGAHGVRMQHNYTGDIAGPAGTVTPDSPRWLRLTRAGDTVTGYASTDGSTWTTVGTVRVALPRVTQAGLFAASPPRSVTTQHLGGGGSVTGGPAVATAVFDNLERQGNWAGGDWSAEQVKTPDPNDPEGPADGLGALHQSGTTLTVTGAGDIVPDVSGVGTPIEQTLAGGFGALIVLVVLGALFITTEYRRGLIRTTLAASPRRGRVLAAKAVVLGTVTFLVSLLAAAITVPLTVHLLRGNGNFIYPIGWSTQVRVVAGTAALLAVGSVLALAVGTILRRSVAAVATVVVLIVLPYILATAGVLPAGPAEWLLRVTPAAGFAIQQSMPEYHQVSQAYTPVFGFYPLAPWAGFAVLCGYAVVALGLASYLLRRRDV